MECSIFQAPLEILNTIIKIDIQIALTAGCACCSMLKRISPAMQFGRLPLQFVHLDG